MGVQIPPDNGIPCCLEMSMKEKLSFKGLWQILKQAFSQFGPDKLTKLSGSLAYCTVFSFGPLLVVLIALAGIFFGREAIEGEIQNQLSGFVGSESAKQLQEIVTKASISGKGILAAVIGGIMLLVGATTVFCRNTGFDQCNLGLKTKTTQRLVETTEKSFIVIFSYCEPWLSPAGIACCYGNS
jgi:membrane protein